MIIATKTGLVMFLVGVAATYFALVVLIEWAWNAVAPVIWHGPAIDYSDAVNIADLLLFVLVIVTGMLKNIAKSKA